MHDQIKALAKYYRYVRKLSFNATLAVMQGQVDLKDNPHAPVAGVTSVDLRKAWLQLTKGV